MTTLRTNIFRILNLAELNAKYRLYRIRGLSKEQPEYYQNKQLLIKSLSYALRTPARGHMRRSGFKKGYRRMQCDQETMMRRSPGYIPLLHFDPVSSRMIEIAGAHRMRVQFDTAKVHDPDKAGCVIDDNFFGGSAGRERPGWSLLWRALLIKRQTSTVR